MVRVTYERERAVVHAEGGIEFFEHVGSIGFCVCDTPTRFMVRLALALRQTAYPLLPALSVEDVLGAGTPWTTEEILAREG